MRKAFNFLLAIASCTAIFAQSGPGGVGTNSSNVIWLDASTLTFGDGADVTSWTDISGNGTIFSASSSGNLPDYLADGGAGFPVVEFDDTNEERLLVNPFSNMPSTTISTIMVFATGNSNEGIISYSAVGNGGGNNEYLFFDANSIRTYVGDANNAGGSFNDGTSTYNIFVSTWQSTGGNLTHYKNGISVNTATIAASDAIVNGGSFAIGGEQDSDDGGYDATQDFGGRIAEIIMFNTTLSNAERIVIENYLSLKYGIAIADDFYGFATAPYDENIIGIGTDGSSGHMNSTGSGGGLFLSGTTGTGSTTFDSNEWLFAAHDGGTTNVPLTTDVSGSQRRIGRIWAIDETATDGFDATFTFNLDDLGLSGATNFVLLKRTGTSGSFSTVASASQIGSEVSFNVSGSDIEDAYFTLGFEYPLLVWLRADVDATVGDWLDQSANGNDASSPENDPTLIANGINFNPAFQFTTAGDRMEGTVTSTKDSLSFLIVAEDRSSANSNGVLIEFDATTNLTLDDNSYAGINFTNNIIKDTAQLITVDHPEGTGPIDIYSNGALFENGTASAVEATTYTYSIGDNVASTNGFDGLISEVIAFDISLASSQRQTIESYLAIKYALPVQNDIVASDGSVVMDSGESSDYLDGLLGLARDDSTGLDQKVAKSPYDSIYIATTNDFTTVNSSRATVFNDSEYIAITNNGADYDLDSAYKSEASVRLNRVWKVHELNDPGNIVIALPNTIDAGVYSSINTMLISSDPLFQSGVTERTVTESGSFKIATVDLTDGQYFTYTTSAPESSIWYSYLSGNWSDPSNWTLDGAISPLYLNPSNEIPSEGDTVVISSGRTITSDLNGILIERAEINGNLDLASTSGHDFNYVLGQGKMRLSGSSGVDNYPAGIDTLFYSGTEGGTVEYYGNGLTLDSKRNYNNLIVNLDNAINEVEQTADSIWVNGNLTISRGKYQFGSNSIADDEVAEVRGNVLVEADGGIEVGSSNSRHEFNLYGDFTNQGVVEFTNRVSAGFESEATDGIVDVNFVSPNQDQVVDLQNTTIFYRLEINKGVDETYRVSLEADDPSYFSLFGFSDQGHGSTAQLAANDNALGLLFGTVALGNNIQIDELTDNGNYNISEGAALEINGGSLSGSRWIVTYGSLIMNAGSLNLGIGTVLRNSGFWEVHGGQVDMGHFRTSALGAGNDGSWTQTGGIVNLTGSGSQADYYTFSLTYETCSFTMTGGELNVTATNSGPDNLKGIFLNAAPENQAVSGGTVTLDMASTESDTVFITSAVPFYNLTILQSANGINPDSKVMITGNNSGGSAPGGVDLPSQDLVVFNDLTIGNIGGIDTTQVDFDGNDVRITGNLILRDSALVDFSDMTVTMEGSGTSQIDVQIPDRKIVVDSLVINKTNEFVPVTIINGYDTIFEVEHYLSIANGNFDLSTFDIQLDGDLNVADTLGSSGSTGVLYMLGEGETVAQTINSTTGGFVYDVLMDNNLNIALNGGNIGFDSLELNDGVLDIGVNKVSLNSPVQTTGTFGTALMIQTDGNASDGGLEYYFDGGTADPAPILYPIGTDANAITRYTPVSLDLSGVSDDGFVVISMSDTELQTTDQSGGNILSYYWRSNNSGFTSAPTAQYAFTYDASDDDASDEANFVPGKVLDESPFTRASEIQANLNTTTNLITFDNDGGGGFALENANYTAGVAGRFVGAPTVYYSRRHQIGGGGLTWTDLNDWSTDAVLQHGGAAASSFPGAGDVVVIGAGQINGADEANDTGLANTTGRHQMVAEGSRTVAEVIFNSNPAGTAIGNNLSRIRLSNPAWDLSAGKISGLGELMLAISTADEATITADFGDFNEEENSTFFLDLTTAGVATFNSITTFPGIRIFGRNTAGKTIRFGNDITGRQILLDGTANLDVASNITISGNVQIGNNRAGSVTFPDVGTNYTFSIGGDLVTIEPNNSTNNQISVATTGTDVHTLQVGGDIDLQFGDLFDLRDATNAILELNGSGNHTFSNTSTANPDLYRIIVNKGSDTTSTFSFNNTFTIPSEADISAQPVTLSFGKLILNDAGINIELADNSDFDIPGTAGLEVTQGTVTSDAASITLDGLLRINGGTATLASSDIEYSSSGNALIDVTSGTLNVGGQIRRTLTSSNGVLKYRQSGGDVDIATDLADDNSRASFEVLNSGSEFTLTGGTFNIERGVSGDANLSLELDPATFNLAGSTISIFENLGANYGSNYFNVSSALDLNNVVIANNIDLPDVRLFNQDLTVNDLTINTNQALLANGFNLSLNGDFINNGVYTNSSSETIISGSDAQSISGSGTFTIFDLRKNGSGTTTLSVSLDIEHDLILTSGTLDMGVNAINLNNDAFIQSVLTNSGGNGLVFNGSTNQELNGLTNTAIDLGTITINNANGVNIPDGNGYDFNITQELRLDGGVFNIGGSLVTMQAGAPITEVSTFNVNNMVQTNSSFTDNGLRIDFFTVATDTIVFFPVGELKYTPVQFELNSGTTNGSIRVRPANERHPTIIDDAEPGTVEDPEIDDTQNVLQYHWIVVAETMTNANGTATFFYDHDDITNIQTDTANFIPARLLSNDVNWDKFAPTLFLGQSQTFQVPLSTFTANEITGDYTAGAGSSDGINADIEGAIPDQLAQYETSFTGSGDYSTAINWNTINGPAVTDGIGPVGAQIIVRSGDDLTLNLDNTRLYATEIEEGAILRVPPGTTGVRLGTVTGSGTIVLEDNELLPTGEYTDFFQCDGGTLQYSGVTSYNVLSGISQVRKVVLEGSGSRILPNNLLTVCDTLEINGPTVVLNSGLSYAVGDSDTDLLDIQAGSVTLSNGSIIDLIGDFEISGGSFSGTENTDLNITDDMTFSGGTLNWNGTDVTLNGSSEQLIEGTFAGTAGFDDLTVNNSGPGITINSGSVEVTGTLALTDGLVNTTGSETLTLTSSGDWTNASVNSYITGPLTKEDILATSTFEFPVGEAARYAPVSIVDVRDGGDDWTAEYFTSMGAFPASTFDAEDPGSGFNALIGVENTDRWEVASVGSNGAQVRATYGPHNAFDNVASIRLVWWDDADASDDPDGMEDPVQNRWENQGGQVDEAASTVTSESSIIFSTRQFALGYAPETVLPVELLDFTALANDNKVLLSWSTVSELNNDYFEVLHSTDGEEFISIGKVNGNGTTNELLAYALTHSNPVPGDNYYQLKQVDYDGTVSLHNVVKVYNDYFKATMDITIYPNPATSDNLNLQISTGDNHTPIHVRIVDLNGRAYYQKTFNGSLSLDERVNPELQMIPGIYFMLVQQGDQVMKQKIVIR